LDQSSPSRPSLLLLLLLLPLLLLLKVATIILAEPWGISAAPGSSEEEELPSPLPLLPMLPLLPGRPLLLLLLLLCSSLGLLRFLAFLAVLEGRGPEAEEEEEDEEEEEAEGEVCVNIVMAIAAPARLVSIPSNTDITEDGNSLFRLFFPPFFPSSSPSPPE